ncbi:hypothetical protein QAD02_005449 [Eretmocerus hayati]|uniref:Uncharacterized protein n=1 Tax=Eretmocerus hayati TaxID=131215 RepID=A0ACC2NVC4_9HYME|nr:hypothetical protein QAD02_005449 [Eretmocerus hayati]
MIAIEDEKVLVGHEDGTISMWQYYRRGRDLDYLYKFQPHDEQAVTHLVNVSRTHFISINKKFEVRLWDKMMRSSSSFDTSEVVKYLRSEAILLPNNLIAIGGNGHSHHWRDMTFWIWDADKKLDFGKCIFQDQKTFWSPRFIHLGVTAQGFLITCGDCHSDISIWRINRNECTKICEGGGGRFYSMSYLPTGDIVTGCHSLEFFRISGESIEFLEEESIDNGNVADFLYPAGVSSLFITYRSRDSDAFRLWNLITRGSMSSDNYISPRGDRGLDITVLERANVVLCLTEKADKIIIHNFVQRDIFHFPKNLAEIRKIARVLFQAQQMEMNYFSRLPVEIIMKIILLTPNCMTESEKKFSYKIATNYFCFPSVRDEC